MVSKLEDMIYSEKYQRPPVIDFEKNELLTGTQWLDLIYKAIVAQSTLQLTYKSFKARQATELVFYPYLLKEYRNRWFVLGMTRKSSEIVTFALDRIVHINPFPEETFRLHRNFDPHTYFNDIVGVTRNSGDQPVNITFFANHYHAPYIKTKPIHGSQKILEEVKGGSIFSINVIPNFELERELIGFGEGLKVITPNSLVRRIKQKTRLMHDLYHGKKTSIKQ
jgi:predicted DNA-binding transcriptional regulator YafY